MNKHPSKQPSVMLNSRVGPWGTCHNR